MPTNLEKPKDFPCDNLTHLPCYFGYLDGEVHRCNFSQKWVRTNWRDGDFQKAEELLKHACAPVRKEMDIDDVAMRIIPYPRNKDGTVNPKKTFIKDFLDNGKEGDIVFYTLDFHGNGEVLLVQKCSSEGSQCIVRNKIGHEYWVDPLLLRVLPNRDHEMEHLVRTSEEADTIKCKAIHVGLTSDVEKKDSGYLVKIRGSNKEELNDFLILAINNDFFSIG